jgi:F1F0 ATPase subunit 2
MGGALAGWALAWIVGLAFGLLHFAGLRWTLERLLQTRRPAAALGLSSLVRLLLLAGALALATDGRPARLACALLGVLVARTWVVSRALRSRSRTAGLLEGARRARP